MPLGHEQRKNERSQFEYRAEAEKIKEQVLEFIEGSNKPVHYRTLMSHLTNLNPDWIALALEELIQQKKIQKIETRSTRQRDSFFKPYSQ